MHSPFQAVGRRVEAAGDQTRTYRERRMQREEFLEHIGEQAEVDPREEAQGRAVFATPEGGVS